MKLLNTEIPEVKVIQSEIHEDHRGCFFECWNARDFAAAGIDAAFVQDNHSISSKHVLRGLHYQVGQPQGKLIRVVSGAVYDVAVDIRKSSPTFGRWVGAVLSARNRLEKWIPAGFAHGYLSLEDKTEVLYKCSGFHVAGLGRAILWSDPAIGIDWPLQGVNPTLSARDLAGKLLSEAEIFP